MNILDFIKKYSKDDTTKNKDWSKDWKSLLKNAQKNDSLALCFHTLLEKYFSFEYLKEIIEYDEKGKEQILNDSNTFKWACAFGSRVLIIYLHDKVKDHNIAGAINATFMQYRSDSLQMLELLGYEKDIYTEPNLCQAISRANQAGCSLNIVDYFLQRLDQFPKLSNYVWKELEKQNWIDKIIENNYETTFEIFLGLNSEKINKEIINKTDEFISHVLVSGKTYLLDKIMNSDLKEDFVKAFNKDKKNLLTNNLSIDIDKNEKDKNQAVNHILDNYPEILKHEDIKLWMMNSRSLKINEFIEDKRKIEMPELKKAFIQLSDNEVTFSRLLNLYPKFDYQVFKIPEAVKILNNVYAEKKYGEIDYDYDGEYMSLSRNILLKNKEFKQYQEDIRTVINDEKMYNLLYKEQIKNNLEDKLGPKPAIKKMKI